MRASGIPARRVVWILNGVGLSAILIGGGWDLVYHFAPFWGMRWSYFFDTLGEFGHTVIFFGVVITLLAVVLKHKA